MLVNFSWIQDGRVAGMGLPRGPAGASLATEGVRAVLTLTAHAAPELFDDEQLVVAHVPLVDFGTPSQEDLARCVAWIDEQLAAQRPVAVHCFAGVGRTGTVLAAWLVRQGATAEEAIARLRRLRPGSVETPGQVEAVRAFAGREAR